MTGLQGALSTSLLRIQAHTLRPGAVRLYSDSIMRSAYHCRGSHCSKALHLLVKLLQAALQGWSIVSGCGMPAKTSLCECN